MSVVNPSNVGATIEEAEVNFPALKVDAAIDGTLRYVQDAIGDVNSTFQIATHKLAIDAADKFYFDGGIDTYIFESAADQLGIFVGGVAMLKLVEAATNQIDTAATLFSFDAVATIDTSGNNLLTLDGGTTGVRLNQVVGININPEPNIPLQTLSDSANTQTVLFDNNGTGRVDLVLRCDQATASGTIGQLLFEGDDDGGNNTRYGQITCVIVDATNTSEDGKLDFYTRKAGTNTKQWTILETGVLEANGAQTIQASSGILTFGSDILASTGIRIGVDSGNNEIDDASQGAASTTLYIGNASIDVTSDVRLKQDVVDTSIDALGLLQQLRIVDFTWDDPTDLSDYGRNYRGRYTGMLAQETIRVAPWIINDQGGGRDCPDCSVGGICHVHPPWKVEYEHLVPTLVKAIQELNAEVDKLRAEQRI